MVAVPCKTCGAPIVFLPTKQGNQMPVDFETYTPGDSVFDAKFHTSHFATCPQAEQHRKRDKENDA